MPSKHQTIYYSFKLFRTFLSTKKVLKPVRYSYAILEWNEKASKMVSKMPGIPMHSSFKEQTLNCLVQ